MNIETRDAKRVGIVAMNRDPDRSSSRLYGKRRKYKVIPPFAATQWLARDREDEIRREVNQEYTPSRGAQQYQPALQQRFANLLRVLANRVDPEPTC